MLKLVVCILLRVLDGNPEINVVRQHFGKHFPVATNTHAIIQEFFNTSISMLSVSYQRRIGNQFFQELLILNHITFRTYSSYCPTCNTAVILCVTDINPVGRSP
jgi:hypothetical protein